MPPGKPVNKALLLKIPYFRILYAAAAKSLQLCLTLCDPIDGSPPGSPVPGILQARTLEWVAIMGRCIYSMYWYDGASGKESTCQCSRRKGGRFDPWVRKIHWSKKWQPTAVFLPGNFCGQRSLVGYSSWGHKESNMTERLRMNTHTHTHTHTHAHM